MAARIAQSPWSEARAYSRWPWPVWLCLYLPFIALLLTVQPVVAGEAGEIVSVLGVADVWRSGRWQAVSAGERIAVGEVVRTGAGSRVAIQLANGSQLKLNANSQLELKQIEPHPQGFVAASVQRARNLLRMLSGEIWIRSVGEPLEVQTPPATATIRGTEFNLAVASDLARLTVVTGQVEFHNPLGSVVVDPGEQAVAKPGEAPRKTVLVNPLDAVQWSLYYPGTVSYRDYPLTPWPPSQRQVQLAGAAQRAAAAPQDVEALIQMGELNFDLGQRAAARQAFIQALRLDPSAARAHTGLGWVYLEAGDAKAALLEFQQARPPGLMTLVGMSNALYRLDRFGESRQVILDAEQRFPTSPIPWTQAALAELIQGRVNAALQALDRARQADPRYAPAYALRSTVYLVQNQRAQALEAARQAIAVNPESPSAWLSLSLAKQAEFQLDDALQAAQKAVALDPANPQTLIQESRLRFGLGQTEKAFKLAEQARRQDPRDAVVNSTWGFLQLARFHPDQAIAAFNESIAADSTRGEPHLGLGIALFQKNKIDQAVEEIQQATLLEPQVALYQSYLGKAYYEIKQESLAQKHLALAKHLDPRDPTPYFYDAILKDSINRPIEALRDLEKSIELNDDRAVYRSRLLLDEDLAARSATRGRIYNEIGFEQLGLNEGRKSLSSDPVNYSAHRLLASSYTGMPGREVARASELLQSQLLQPINITPVSPQLAETRLFIPAGLGPATASLYEYNPLFLRNSPMLFASGIVGNHGTLSDELILSGVANNVSYSLGQFHYQTDGWRNNSDLQHNIYNFFTQAQVNNEFNVQAEYRYRRSEFGDLTQNFNRSYNLDRREVHQEVGRVGSRYSPSPETRLITSLIYADRDTNFKSDGKKTTVKDKGYQGEAQLLHKANDYLSLITGLGAYRINVDNMEDKESNFWSNQTTAYNYAYVNILDNLIWTAGFGYESYRDSGIDFSSDKMNPKLGMVWTITDNLSLRAAAFRKTQPPLPVNQTIEPTQVAGFNQLFDYASGTQSRQLGIGLDSQLSSGVFAGLEALKRKLEIPTATGDDFEIEDGKENFYHAYFYWTPSFNWAIAAEYFYEKFKFNPGKIFENSLAQFPKDSIIPFNITTNTAPLTINYFNPSGFFTQTSAAMVWQQVDIKPTEGKDSDRFFLLDIDLGYHLPKRWGTLSIGITNVLDRQFKYQQDNIFLFQDGVNPRFFPERMINARIFLNF